MNDFTKEESDMKNIATIALCDHQFAGDNEHYSFAFCSLQEGAQSCAFMNTINHNIPYPAIYLNKSQLIALRDWCDSLIVSKV